MAATNTMAIDITRRRFRAVEVSRAGQLLRVERVLVHDVPERLDLGDAAAVGAWMGATLTRHGFRRGRVTIAMSREHVALKRITLPTVDSFELPDMVRLSMQRELPFDPADAVIDFVPAEVKDGRTTVLAAAMQRSLVVHMAALAKAAGLRIERISLRCMGVSSLLRTLVDERDRAGNAWLGVDVTDDGVELSVLTEDGIRFSRAAEVPRADKDSDFIDGVITETKRSWMSYRIVEDAPAISGGFVFGDRRITKSIHDALADLMSVKVEPIHRHPRIDASSHDLAGTWPLAGLLLEPLIGARSFDFASPRRPPDRAARVRQRLLAAAGIAIVLLAGSYAIGFAHVRRLSHEQETLASQIKSEAEDFYRYQRDRARLDHLEQWLATRVNWLEHLRAVQGHLPGPELLVLDEWSASLRDPRIEFDRNARGGDRWSAPLDIQISLAGEAKAQTIVDSLRESFVESREYTAAPVGPDSQDGRRYPYPFKLAVRSSTPSPAIEEDLANQKVAESAAGQVESSGDRGDEGS